MSNTDPSQPPAKLPLDPQTLKVVIVGAVVLVLLVGADVALELTGHGDSPVAGIIVKVLTGIVGIVTAYQAGRGPGPEHAQMKARIALLEKHSSVPPSA